MDFIAFLIIFFASFVVVWLVSFLVEALRPAPKTPEAMPWDPRLKPAYVTVDGVKLRYRLPLKPADISCLLMLQMR